MRVVAIPGFSAELCGGTHVRATGDIGCFKITEITALSAGQRRIVAITGPKAVELFQESYATVKLLSQEYKVPLNQIVETLEKQREQHKNALSEIKKLKKQRMHTEIPLLLEQIQTVGSVPLFVNFLNDYSGAELKELVHEMLTQKPGLYIVLSPSQQGEVLYAEISPSLQNAISFKELSAWLTQKGLRCGGKGVSLQGGGNLNISKHAFIQELQNWVQKQQG